MINEGRRDEASDESEVWLGFCVCMRVCVHVCAQRRFHNVDFTV